MTEEQLLALKLDELEQAVEDGRLAGSSEQLRTQRPARPPPGVAEDDWLWPRYIDHRQGFAHEVPKFLVSAKEDGLKILWVPVSASLVGETELTRFQAVIDPIKPLNKMHHAYVDEALVTICRAVKDALGPTT